MPFTIYRDRAPYKESLGPGEVQQGPRVPGSDHQAPINRAFIEKYCAPRQAQGEAPQHIGDGQQRATDAPPTPPGSTSAHLQRL